QFTFSMVVAVFVLCIALGSFAVSALPRIPAFLLPGCLWCLLILLALLYLGADDLPYWAYALRSLFQDQDADFYPYYLSAFAGLLALIALPVALSGAVLPLIFHALRDRVGDLGEVAGRLYSWNTLGSLLGALIGGYALLFWLDLHHTYRIAMGAVAVAALLAGGFAARPASRFLGGALLLGSALAIAALPAWRVERLNAGLVPKQGQAPANLPSGLVGPERFYAAHPLTAQNLKGGGFRWIFHDDDPTASVTVTERIDGRGRRVRALRNSGRPEGGSEASDKTMRLAGLLPALLADKIERAFVVGYGLGMTVGELASLSSMREVVVAEISPGVIEAAPLFDEESLGASKHPAVEIVNSDAYRALIRSQEKFDAIASIPSHTYVAGVEMLFSREFLEAARDRLAPGGVYLQWFNTYGIQGDEAEPTAMALRTFAEVFPTVAVWYGTGTELLILGLMDDRDALDLDRIERLSLRKDVAAGLDRAEIPDLAALLAHELLPVGVVHTAPLPGPIHTLLHPRLGNLAARAVFAGAEAVLPATADQNSARVGERNSLQRRFAARFGGRLPESQRGNLVGQLCLHRPRECQTQLAAWILDVPASSTREIVIAALREASKGRINPVLVPTLLPLFGVAGAESPPITPEEAARITDRFVAFYTHATPFPREVLAEVWRRCAEDPAQQQACRAGRAAAELRLGPLGGEHAATPGPA
ncbi:MAG TPA: fused MFS/spermidine synthase, partial [Myxococcota bacterium]